MTSSKMEIISQAIENQLLITRAIAVVLMRGDSVVVKKGGLTDNAFQILGVAMRRHWPVSLQGNTNRYVGLTLDNKFYCLFAKILPENDYLLGLVFPLQTPLIRMRQDMTDFMRAVLAIPIFEPGQEVPLERSLQFILESTPGLGPEPDQTGWRLEVDQTVEQIEDVTVPEEPIDQTEINAEKPVDKITRSLSFGAPVEQDIQKPSSGETPREMDVLKEEIPWQPIGENWPEPSENGQDGPITLSQKEYTSPEKADLSQKPNAWQPLGELPFQEDDLVSILQDDFVLREDLDGLEEWLPALPTAGEPVSEEPEAGLDEGIFPNIVNVDKETWEEEVSDITFYLVPKLDENYLLGELPHQLRRWLPAICKTYGWQLDFLSVRPDYLKWTLGDFPESLIREMLRIVRQATSNQIFRVFPNLQQGVLPHDFWSPGYLVDTQNREFSTQALISHVSKWHLGVEKAQ